MEKNKPTRPSNDSTAIVPAEASADRFARDHAEILVKSCPTAKEGPDRVALVAAVYQLFLKYPQVVVAEVSDPVEGLPSRQRYGLVIADVVEALDASMGPIYREQDRRKRAEEFERIAGPRDSEPQKPHYETLNEKVRHLSNVPFPQVPEGPEKDRIRASVAAEAARTIAFFKAKGGRDAAAKAEAIRNLAEQITGKPL